MITSSVLARLIAGLISVIQASNLRNRVYSQQNRIDTLELAIEDILRISRSTVSEDQPVSYTHLTLPTIYSV